MAPRQTEVLPLEMLLLDQTKLFANAMISFLAVKFYEKSFSDLERWQHSLYLSACKIGGYFYGVAH